MVRSRLIGDLCSSHKLCIWEAIYIINSNNYDNDQEMIIVWVISSPHHKSSQLSCTPYPYKHYPLAPRLSRLHPYIQQVIRDHIEVGLSAPTTILYIRPTHHTQLKQITYFNSFKPLLNYLSTWQILSFSRRTPKMPGKYLRLFL